MEVEHKHDTSNAIPHRGEFHVHPEQIKNFEKSVDKSLGELQKKA
jgi:hypothetical protein